MDINIHIKNKSIKFIAFVVSLRPHDGFCVSGVPIVLSGF